LLLILLCTVFGMVIALVVRKSEKLQSTVEGYYTDVAERTSDTLGNIALVQSFTRVEAEVSGMRKMGEEVLRAHPCPLLVGGDDGHYPHVHDADNAFDPGARSLVLPARPDHRRRNRHVHELCNAPDWQA